MKMKNTELLETTAHLLSVEKMRFTAKNGSEAVIVVVRTDKGNFSNYVNVWNRQNIDLDKLDEGDEIRIAYTTFVDAEKNVARKNFVRVDYI